MGNNIDTGNYSRNNIVEVTSNNIKQSEYRAETYAQKAEKSLLECLSCTSLVQGILNACTEIKENLENLFFTDLDEHKEDNENPHNVTAAQVGTYTKETIDNLLSVKQPVGNYLTEHQDITGKQDAITSSDKLDADLVDDTTSSHKFVSTSDINTWNGKQNTDTAVTHTASTGVGSATKGVYIASDGTATAMTYSVEKDVPSNAVFTDTTYNVMTGADGTSAGTSGLVPAPAATDNTKYLKGDGTYDTPTDTTYTFSTGLTNTSDTITVTDYDKLVKNTAVETDSLSILGTQSSGNGGTINIGYNSKGFAVNGVAIGTNSETATNATAIGYGAKVLDTMQDAAFSGIQLGYGTNNDANTMYVGFLNANRANYKLLDGTTGLIPDARLSSNIARTSAIPTVNNATLTIQKNSTTVQTFTANASSDVTCNITVPTATSDLTNDSGYITNSAITNMQTTTNLVTSISSLSTDTQYPSAKCVYDIIGDIESLLSQV